MEFEVQQDEPIMNDFVNDSIYANQLLALRNQSSYLDLPGMSLELENKGKEECQWIYQNITYRNVTCDTSPEYAVPLYGHIAPIFMLITLVANLAIVIVLSKKNMQTPTNAVLMAMAICDFATILFPAPVFVYMFTFENHSRPLGPVNLCYIFNLLNETLPLLFHTASIWLTVALAFQRYIYVCHAPLARIFLTMSKVRKSIFYIILAAVIHSSFKLFDMDYFPLEIEWENRNVTVCHTNPAAWIEEHIGVDLYFSSFYLFRVIFVHLIPCIALIVLNILLFRAMKIAQQKRQELFGKCCKKSKRANDKNCTTLMLIIVVSVFLTVEVPLAIITSLHVMLQMEIISFLDYDIANLCILLLNFFLILSYPVNFALYCGMSRQFRETFRNIFCGKKSTENGNNVTNFMGGSRKQHEMSSRYSLVNVNGPKTNTTNETVL